MATPPLCAARAPNSQRVRAENTPHTTRGRKWILLYSERCKTRNEAMSREWYIKHDRKFRNKLRATIRA
jgi:predicted GIY-YIG superfamily endonuclease